jgi:poly(beta-D-mannuronate) C5 epimerase
MRRKQVPIAILVASITALWMAASDPFSKPVLPALPDLDGWVSVLEAWQSPPVAPGEVAVGRPEQAPALRGSYLDAARTMAGWSGDALVIESGVHTIESLATAAARPDLLRCLADGCELRAPLLVSPGAGLVIAGAPERPLRLRLVQESGAYIVNTGRLHIAWARIVGWSFSTQAAAETDGAGFRPFIVGFGASETVVLHSELHHLGFFGTKSYGLTLSSLSRAFPTSSLPPACSPAGSTSSTVASTPMRRGRSWCWRTCSASRTNMASIRTTRRRIC